MASVNNPLVDDSPAIDWDVHITIDGTDPRRPRYTVTGAHDGYPAYDIYINGTRIYVYDPRITGAGVGSLLPPMEHTISASGVLP